MRGHRATSIAVVAIFIAGLVTAGPSSLTFVDVTPTLPEWSYTAFAEEIRIPHSTQAASALGGAKAKRSIAAASGDVCGLVGDALQLGGSGAQFSLTAERNRSATEPTPKSYMAKFRYWREARLGKPGKLLCATYTYDKKHKNVVEMRALWGKRCDRHIIFTNDEMDADLAQVDLRDIIKLVPRGGESYHNMWQKTREAFMFLTASDSSWTDEYDYFFFGGDDVFLVPENLRRMLSEPDLVSAQEAGTPLFFGYRSTTRDYDSKKNAKPWFPGCCETFISGAGYVLNTVALKLAGALVRHSPKCFAESHVSFEDVYLANCFRSAGVVPRDSRDTFGEDRFVILNLDHMTWQARDQGYSWWWRDYRDHQIPTGLDIISRDVVLLHYVAPNVARDISAAIYGREDKGRDWTMPPIVDDDD
jgi:glycoprotein-N-acetylgalactosamine 3-beta-galactosyltransferase